MSVEVIVLWVEAIDKFVEVKLIVNFKEKLKFYYKETHPNLSSLYFLLQIYQSDLKVNLLLLFLFTSARPMYFW